SGYPYIFFTDTVNRNAPDVYHDLGRKIYSTNLCAEIAHSSSPDESFVCNLSSLNLLHYEDWENTDLVETLVMFLDAVMEEYIEKTADMPLMQTARNFAKRQRAIGIGVLGWHSLLQSRMIPFESLEAQAMNIEIHKRVSEQALEAS